MAKKKCVGDLTLREIVKRCHKRRECTTCPLVGFCGNVFGAYNNKILNAEADEL